MDRVISDNEQLKYRVVRGSAVLKEAFSYTAATAFIDTLSEDEKDGVTIVPVTATGSQVLFG